MVDVLDKSIGLDMETDQAVSAFHSFSKEKAW